MDFVSFSSQRKQDAVNVMAVDNDLLDNEVNGGNDLRDNEVVGDNDLGDTEVNGNEPGAVKLGYLPSDDYVN
jgi:hypothetical protein